MSNKNKRGNPVVVSFWEGRSRTLHFFAAVFFLILAAVFPLTLHPANKYVLLTTQKAIFFWITAGSAAAVFALLLSYYAIRAKSGQIACPPEHKKPVSLPEYFLAAYVLLALVSALASPHKDVVWMGYAERWEGFVTLLMYGLVFVLIARFYRPRGWHLMVFAASSILVSLIAVLQFMDVDFLNLFPHTRYDFIDAMGNPILGGLSIQFRTTLGNADIVSAYACLVAVFFAAMYAGEQSRWRYVYLAAGTMGFALILVAGADAGKAGILAAMVLMIPYWVADKKRLGRVSVALSSWAFVYAAYWSYLQHLKALDKIKPLSAPYDMYFVQALPERPALPFWLLAAALLFVGLALLLVRKDHVWPRKRAVTIGCVLLAAAMIGGVTFVEVMGKRWAGQPTNIVYQAREMMHGNLEDNFGSNRGWVWKRALQVAPDHLWLGTGPDTFQNALTAEMQEEAIQTMSVVFDRAHNAFLQILVCTGLPSLIAYLLFAGTLFAKSIKKAFERPLLLAAGAAALCYLAQSFFGVDAPISAPFLWMTLGLMAGELWRAKQENAAKAE